MSDFFVLKWDGEAYYWWKDNHKLCQCWFILQGFLRARYVSPIYSSESDCREPNVEQEPEPKNQPITNHFTAKVEANLEPSVLFKPDVLDELESEVVAELVSL